MAPGRAARQASDTFLKLFRMMRTAEPKSIQRKTNSMIFTVRVVNNE
jgi:hypothetical protein